MDLIAETKIDKIEGRIQLGSSGIRHTATFAGR